MNANQPIVVLIFLMGSSRDGQGITRGPVWAASHATSLRFSQTARESLTKTKKPQQGALASRGFVVPDYEELHLHRRLGGVVQQHRHGATGEACFGRVGAAGEDGRNARAEHD